MCVIPVLRCMCGARVSFLSTAWLCFILQTPFFDAGHNTHTHTHYFSLSFSLKPTHLFTHTRTELSGSCAETPNLPHARKPAAEFEFWSRKNLCKNFLAVFAWREREWGCVGLGEREEERTRERERERARYFFNTVASALVKGSDLI